MKAALRVYIPQVTELVAGDFHTAAKLEDGTLPPFAASASLLTSVLRVAAATSVKPLSSLCQASVKPLLSLH